MGHPLKWEKRKKKRKNSHHLLNHYKDTCKGKYKDNGAQREGKQC